MAKGKGKNSGAGHSKKRPIERYEHTDKKRINNPPVALVTPETDPPLPTHKIYDYVQPVPTVRPGKDLDYDPQIDPQLVWAGKKEHTSFEVHTVSLHVHKTIDPRTIIEAVRRRNGNGLPAQPSLFDRPEEKLPLRDAIDFYKHAHGWSNRLIAGDSLLVMNSLLEKEGMADKCRWSISTRPMASSMAQISPASRRRTKSRCSVKALVKQVRSKNSRRGDSLWCFASRDLFQRDLAGVERAPFANFHSRRRYLVPRLNGSACDPELHLSRFRHAP